MSRKRLIAGSLLFMLVIGVVIAWLFMMRAGSAPAFDVLTTPKPQVLQDAEQDAKLHHWPDAVSKNLQAGVLVQVEISALTPEENHAKLGSGVVVRPNLILTALHLLPPFPELVVSQRLMITVTVYGKEIKGHIPDMRYVDFVHDLALIKLSQPVAIPPVRVALRDPAVGSPLYAFGYSFPDRPATIATDFKGDTQQDGIRYFLVYRGIEFGYSGSMFLNEEGELVGIGNSISPNGAFSLVTPREYVELFLARIPS